MPIFSRRTNQMMLDEIRSRFDPNDFKELLGNINKEKLTDQVIPAETELSILYALRNLDGFYIKPKDIVVGKIPEFGIQKYIDDVDLVGEVFAISDGSIEIDSRAKKISSIRNSKLYKTLKRKKDQINTTANCIKMLIVGGFQSEFLSKTASPMSRLISGSPIFAEDILTQFINDHDKKVSAILLLTIIEDGSTFTPNWTWRVTCFPVDMQPQIQSIIDHLLMHLPKPLTKGIWARTTHQAKKFRMDSPINYLATKKHWDKSTGWKISISSRALLDFLRQKITEEEFRNYVDYEGIGLILENLNQDPKIIDQISIVQFNPEKDDDLIEITFKHDVAVQKYS